MEPLVSVLVTVYNREPYLAECLESILGSSFEDFEVVVVDDGSQDGSLAIAREFAGRDPRVRVHENPVNLGDYPNRNRAAALARGRYLKYVDSDDTIRPECLVTMVEAMEAYPEAAYCLSYPRPKDLARPACLTPHEAYRCHLLEHQGIFSSGPLLALIRADRFREVHGFRPGARNMGDTILWMELSKRWPMVLVADGLTWWRTHEGQESSLLLGASRDNALTHVKLTGVMLDEFLRAGICPLGAREARRVRRRAHLRNLERVAWHLRHARFSLAALEARWAALSLLGLPRDLPRPSNECVDPPVPDWGA